MVYVPVRAPLIDPRASDRWRSRTRGIVACRDFVPAAMRRGCNAVNVPIAHHPRRLPSLHIYGNAAAAPYTESAFYRISISAPRARPFASSISLRSSLAPSGSSYPLRPSLLPSVPFRSVPREKSTWPSGEAFPASGIATQK